MPVYEYVRAGQVVERVQPVDTVDDHEATRLGIAAIEAREAAERGQLGDEYWRVAGDELTNTEPAATEDPAGPTTSPDTAPPARPATSRHTKEK